MNHFYREANRTSCVLYTSLHYCLTQFNRFFYTIFNTRGYFTSLFTIVQDFWRGPASNRKDAGWANQQLLEWLDLKDTRPFAAYVHYMEPHTPYDPEPRFDKMFRDPAYHGPEAKGPPPPGVEIAIPPLSRGKELPDDQRRHLINMYDGCIATFDAYLEDLIRELKDRGLYDNTVIVLTGDHGEEFYEHGGWWHGHSLYQEIIHVPLIIKLPADQHAGLVIKGACRHVDIVPTILELAGVEPWSTLQGVSLYPLIRDERADWPGIFALSEMYSQGNHVSSMIAGPDKVMHIQAREELLLLYHLDSDPGEMNPARDVERERAKELDRDMDKKIKGYEEKKLESSFSNISEQEKQKLKALGYIVE